MENDAAEDMQDQSRIMDTLFIKPFSNASGSNVVKILPGSTLSWYDSNTFVQNTEFSFAPSTGTQSTLTLAGSESQNSTEKGLLNQDLSKMQKKLDENPQLRSWLEKDESSVPESLDPEISNKILQGGNSTVFSDLVDPASNSSVYGNIRVPAGSFINPQNIGVVLRNNFGQTRTTYPNNIGRFAFNQVPIGDYFVSVIRDENLINSINSTIDKPIIVTGEKHIGVIDGNKTILIQDIGYYYNTDYNNDGHMGDADLKDFMDTAMLYDVEEGNTLYSTDIDTSVEIMPYNDHTQVYDSNHDRKLMVSDVSNAEDSTWADPMDDTSLDIHYYYAYSTDDSIPYTVSRGEANRFTITFKDVSNPYSEDNRLRFLEAFSDSVESDLNGGYYHLLRLDSSPITTTVVNRKITNNEEGIFVTFTVEYRVPSSILGDSYDLSFGLTNPSQKYSKVYFGRINGHFYILPGMGIVTTKLSNADEFLKILNGIKKYYGGSQSWYLTNVGRESGCGPVAAANILAYLVLKNPEFSSLYSYDINNLSKDDFLKHMNEVIKYVEPLKVPGIDQPAGGLPFLSWFANDVEEFSDSKGVILGAQWSYKYPTFENAVEYIKEGLKKDSPVALINMWNPKLANIPWTDPEIPLDDPNGNIRNQNFQVHWVTITAITENNITGQVTIDVSSWGGKATLNFNDVWNNEDWRAELFPTGIIYFD